MRQPRTKAKGRRAAIAPLTALLLIPLLAVTAFAVDLGWIVLVQSDLQNAADASALAGAGQLTDGYVQYNLPGQSSSQQGGILNTAEANAKTYAKNFAGYNTAGNTLLTTVLDNDIEFGFTDASGNYTPSTPGSGYPNTIKVTLRRDTTANTPLGLFFGPVLGLSTVNLKATAASSIYAVNIDNFANTSSLHLGMLPVTYDVNNWNNFLASGQDPDGHTSTDANGNPDLNVYPSIKDTGNFGLLGLDDSHAGASTVSSWITNGFTQTDLQTLLSNSAANQTPLIPLSQHNPNILPTLSTDGMGSWNWIGDTGMKTSVLHTLSGYIGNTYLLPLFKPLNDGTLPLSTYQAGNGNGSHYYYNIVQFVSVKLVYVDNKSVVVEPSATTLNPIWVVPSSQPTPAGTGNGNSSHATTFEPPKLSQ